MKINKAILMTSTLTSLTLLAGTTLASVSVSADDSAVDEINITVPVSCSMSGTGMNTHNKDIPNGTYQNNIGTTTLKAFCNDNNGFAIYAAGYTGDEIGAENSNKLVNSALTTNNTIVTGTATTAGNPDVSNWAMKLNTNTSATYAITLDNNFNNYSAVPNEYTKVAHRDSATGTTDSEAAELTTTYAAYISKTQPAGTYSGKVIYTLVHPSNAPAPIACNNNATTIAEVKCMQDFGNVNSENRAAIIASMTPGQQYTLKDSRDGKTYTIAKYQTGTDATTSQPTYDVWMTQNLDLDLQAGVTYTQENTDIGYDTETNTYKTASWSPSSSTMTSSNNNWTMSATTPESYDPGDLYWNGTISDYSDWDEYYGTCTEDPDTWQYSDCDESKNPLATYVSSTGTPQYHLGNYYNWTAALAMNDSTNETDSSKVIEQSICPAGWTLPRIGEGEDSFYSLWNKYNFTDSSFIDDNSNNTYDAGENALWTSPLYFTAGGYYGGVVGNVGRDGYFWSPVAGNSDGARGAFFYTAGSVYPSDYSHRGSGRSVRCIARPVVSSDSDGGGGGGA